MSSDLLTYEFVCKHRSCRRALKKCVELPTSHRSVMLVNIRGQVFCMDQACYRTSQRGRVFCGDVQWLNLSFLQTMAGFWSMETFEELGDKVTINCMARLTIQSGDGEGLYKGVDMNMSPSA
ncbi:hypothetical protein GQ600_4004 [Phytophthora cactorum]|nr:hypothetical protein GQ600_4004 [Phytophthora cactorum]